MVSYDELDARIAQALELCRVLEECESALDQLLHMRSSTDSAQKARTSIVPDIWDENDLATTVGERIRFERKKRGWPQKELASATGIARPNIARLESGRQIPSLPTLQRVARSFGVPLSELLRPVG
jgi:ribosome-binding protein aMBF1 (putative translation factor)